MSGRWNFSLNTNRARLASTFAKCACRVRSVWIIPARRAPLTEDWTRLSGLLVAVLEEQPIGYAGLILDRITKATWVTDLVVDKPLRRQGIGSALLLAAAEWAATIDSHTLVLEMQPKNDPAIRLSFKLGFEFCGYNDLYYPDHEIGVFFRKSI